MGHGRGWGGLKSASLISEEGMRCGCLQGRDGVEGGEGGLKGGDGGGGVGWDPPPPWVPLWSLPKAGRKFFSLNPLGAEAEFWLSASNIGRGGGGYPPSSYGVRPF